MLQSQNDPTVNMSEQQKQQMLHQITLNTIEFRIRQWVDNFTANVPIITGTGSKGVASLFEKLKDVPAIIVGSGPTLDWNINQMKEMEKRGIIIVCDSALKSLMEKGIMPHIVLITDSKERVANFMQGIDLSQINVILDSFVHPRTYEVVKEKAKRIYWYSTLPVEAEPWTGALNQWTGYIGNLGTGGCVATTAWWLAARFFACDPVVLVGLPQSFYDPGQMYAPSVAANNIMEPYSTAPIKTRDIHGNECYTYPALQSFTYWFEDAFLNTPILNINCSEGGIIQRNVLNMPFAECASRYMKEEYDIESLLFINEMIIDSMVSKIDNPLASEYKNMLMILLDGPSLPNLSLRIGKSENETHQLINDLRDSGLQIEENINKVGNPYTGDVVENLVFTLMGYNGGSGGMVSLKEPVNSIESPQIPDSIRPVIRLNHEKYAEMATDPSEKVTPGDFKASQIASSPAITMSAI